MKFINSNTLHLWSGLIFGLPLVLVGITAVLIAHEDRLGLDEIPVAVDWLPGYGAETAMHELTEVKAFVELPDGSRVIGTKKGVVRIAPAAGPVLELAGQDVRALATAHDGILLAATKMGLFRAAAPGVWQRIADGDFHHVDVSGNRWLAAEKDAGLLVSNDAGASWRPDPEIAVALGSVSLPAETEQTSLKELVDGVHTGKAFLGKSAEWIWIDLLGVCMIGLGITGVVVWMRRRRRRDNMTTA